ncbi:MAG: FAD-binding oxidoreductase [Planctomycetales bacterium]
MLTRREMLKTTVRLGAAVTLPALGGEAFAARIEGVEVNDAQSRLNPTRVRRIVQPGTLDEIQTALRDSRRDGRPVSVAAGRHAMGGQQFGSDAVLLDTTRFDRVVRFDRERGRIEVESGTQWPELIEYLHREQQGDERPWAVRQKQSGVDRVSIGGSLAANIHGRGLRFPPFIDDVESFELLDARGKLHTCSRRENAELFSLAIGGYGLFGVVTHVTLRLVPRTKLERVVEVIAVKDLLGRVEERVRDGFTFGDCQYSIDLATEAEAHPGVFSCYRPIAADTPIRQDGKQFSADDWSRLYALARTDKKRAFETYARHYLETSGQAYWSDKHQLSSVFEGYRAAVDERRGTEMITEVYVSKEALLPFLAQVRRDFLEHDVDLTYGTIRFIERDRESFLCWARESCVCVVCNLHVPASEDGREKVRQDFRRIIDRAIEHGGRYYLTYHRWATRPQVEACYPRFVEFLRLKRKYDPQEIFQSDWYRHYRNMFADAI